jgi:hypothetical protein
VPQLTPWLVQGAAFTTVAVFASGRTSSESEEGSSPLTKGAATVCVGPISHNGEAASKAAEWLAAHPKYFGWSFTGEWYHPRLAVRATYARTRRRRRHSENGTSFAKIVPPGRYDTVVVGAGVMGASFAMYANLAP